MKSLPALALFAFVSPSIQAQEPALQADWFQSPTTGNWYGLDYSYRTWTDSEALSVSLGGHLATIRSQAEQDWMVTQFSVYGHAWYLGLNDEVTEGTFEWSSGEPVTFTAWAAGEPNNAGNEDYTEVKEDYTWQDLKDNHAGIGARPFIELPTTTKPEVGWSWPETFVTATGPGYGTLGDFDGDGDLDYASTYKSDNSLAIFWNDGQGSFIPGQVVVVPKNDPYMVVASDPDKDGDLDLVVSCRSDDLRVVCSRSPTGTGPSPLALRLAAQFRITESPSRIGMEMAWKTSSQRR